MSSQNIMGLDYGSNISVCIYTVQTVLKYRFCVWKAQGTDNRYQSRTETLSFLPSSNSWFVTRNHQK